MGAIIRVGKVGHCHKNPKIISPKPRYCGWRKYLYNPVVANRPLCTASYRVFQADATIKKPPPTSKFPPICRKLKWGSTLVLNRTSHKWPELWDKSPPILGPKIADKI